MSQVGNDEFPITIQDVTTNSDYEVKRLRVPGGWLVLIRDQSLNQSLSEFIGDPNHEWTLET